MNILNPRVFFCFLLFFQEALNERGNEDIWNLLEEMGGMPLLGSNRGGGWNKDNYSLADLLAKTKMPIPFRMSITKDLFQTSQYVVWVRFLEF